MKRRQFMAGLGGAATLAWPRVARAQLDDSPRRLGFLTGLAPDDPEGRARRDALLGGLREQGWAVGRNLEIVHRTAGRDPERYRQFAEDLVAMRPDALLAGGTPAFAALQKAVGIRPLPIVFANATDPAGGGYIARLARPGRNTTGFVNFETRFAWKWLELLKQLAPHVARVAIFAGGTSTGTAQMETLRAAAPRFRVELTTLGDHDGGEIERGIAAFVHGPTDGLIVTAQLDRSEREQIIALAARYRLPAVYPFRRYVTEGGLICYGTNQIEPYRLAAGYVDRILSGERPFSIPVLAAGKSETVINLKTARALGFDIPDSILMRADEVIE